VAAVAIVVVESSAFGLLRVEAEFGVGFAALDIAAGESHREYYHGDTKARRKPIRGNH
jgi:hypothetical protein